MVAMKIRSCRNAFTLLEIMIVVTIIAILMGAAIYKKTHPPEKGQREGRHTKTGRPKLPATMLSVHGLFLLD